MIRHHPFTLQTKLSNRRPALMLPTVADTILSGIAILSQDRDT